MRRKHLFLLVTSLLVFLMTFSVVMAAPPEHAGKQGPPDHAKENIPWLEDNVVEVEKTYQFLNPAGIPGPIEVQGLVPRLDTIEGKTIIVHVNEAGPQTGPYLYQYLVENYPNTNWVHIQNNGFGPTRPEQEVLDNADALIGGQSW